MKYIASCSFGKDSLAMLLLIIERGLPIDEVVFYDTGKEFQAIYDTRDKVLPLLHSFGIEYTELKPEMPFDFKMFDKPVKKRGTDIIHKHGYSWCGGTCRWGTTDKLRALEKYANGNAEYVGIAKDETKRLEKERKEVKAKAAKAYCDTCDLGKETNCIKDQRCVFMQEFIQKLNK